ncbi:DDE-type integrase/transposase/recombinase [Streptomyces sp. GD-15H]|uniref:transposase n=1 Tax=Streptomyces sp. GD-15H TaxID=3129112 RepID=UPI0032547458
MSSATPSYQGHRRPVETVSRCVGPYFRFPLGFRGAGEPMPGRGVLVSHESGRRWCAKFGQTCAAADPGDKWHLDEALIKINGEPKYLWRAVDADVPGILVRGRRDKAAARRFFRHLLKTTRTVPRGVVTDRLRPCGAAHREAMPSVEHRSHQGPNHRVENSHRPTRQRERARKGCRSACGARRLPAACSGISPRFRPRRHLMTATEYRTETTPRLALWDRLTGAAAVPTAACPRPPPAPSMP